MSQRKYRLDVCPECKVREGVSSRKRVYECSYCERWFCKRHLEPRLTVIRDFKTVIKDTAWANIVEKEWRRKDGHPDFAYTWERFEELKVQKAITGAKMEALLDKSKGYGKPITKEPAKERKFYFKKEIPSYEPKTRKPFPTKKVMYERIGYVLCVIFGIVLSIVGFPFAVRYQSTTVPFLGEYQLHSITFLGSPIYTWSTWNAVVGPIEFFIAFLLNTLVCFIVFSILQRF